MTLLGLLGLALLLLALAMLLPALLRSPGRPRPKPARSPLSPTWPCCASKGTT